LTDGQISLPAYVIDVFQQQQQLRNFPSPFFTCFLSSRDNFSCGGGAFHNNVVILNNSTSSEQVFIHLRRRLNDVISTSLHFQAAAALVHEQLQQRRR